MPILWALFFYWVVFGTGLPERHDFVSGWMESNFTKSSFIKSASILLASMAIWRLKIFHKFPLFIVKFLAGSLLGAIIGADFASAMYNYQLEQRMNNDAHLFMWVGILTWLCYLGIINILNEQTP